jgi:hypothetical protein
VSIGHKQNAEQRIATANVLKVHRHQLTRANFSAIASTRVAHSRSPLRTLAIEQKGRFPTRKSTAAPAARRHPGKRDAAGDAAVPAGSVLDYKWPVQSLRKPLTN